MTNPVPPLLPTILLEVLILCLWTSRNRLAQATGDVVCIAQGKLTPRVCLPAPVTVSLMY